ncbi:RHS repeat-associated core domain-containing protein, partial [Pseudoalteromonas sp. BZP1]
HMNGRVYDYNLGRFLSVDPVIQFVGNSQGINPYSYIMNNPMAGTDPTGYVIDTIWDVGNVIFDVGKVAYGAATGNDDMVTEGLTDLAIDAAATLVPFVPAGASKAARAGAEKVADARQASKKTDTTPTTQKSESSSNTDGGTKTTNGADNTQSANSAGQKTTDIGSPSQISKKDQLAQNKAQGKAGEAKVRQELGDANRGEQVTVETLDGDRARVDFVTTKDGQPNLVEVKTGNASLSKGQQAVKDAIGRGEPVIPRGANAEKAGLPVGEKIACSFEEKRC